MSTLLTLPVKKEETLPLKTWQIFVNDLQLMCHIGVFPHEQIAPQGVKINLKCDVICPAPLNNNDLSTVVCYDKIIQKIQILTQNRHVFLVEVLAEDIADLCLQDDRIKKVWVRVEKTDVYKHVSGVGVEITRGRL